MLNIFLCIHWLPLFFLLLLLSFCFFACLGGSSLEKCLFGFSTHFFNWLLFFCCCCWVEWGFHIFWYYPLVRYMVCKCPFSELFFHFVDSCFCCEELFSLMQSHLLIFAFCFLPQKTYILAYFFFLLFFFFNLFMFFYFLFILCRLCFLEQF